MDSGKEREIYFELIVQQNKDWNLKKNNKDMTMTKLWINCPTEQGLKLLFLGFPNNFFCYFELIVQQNKDWNNLNSYITIPTIFLWINCPTEQGLKHKDFGTGVSNVPLWINCPTEQGLKLTMNLMLWRIMELWINCPTEQGLKHADSISSCIRFAIFELIVQQNKDWNLLPIK